MSQQATARREVINVHAHIHRTDDVPRKVAEWMAEGAVRTCVQCIPAIPGQPDWGVMNGKEIQPWIERYPDHLVGFAGVNQSLQPDSPAVVGEWRSRGFKGLKCIRPERPYDDDAFMPVYEAAARLGMAVLFHTGYLSFPKDYRGPSVMDFMRPVRLERIARYFPELQIIGAHLGSPWCEEAVKLMLSHPNVHFDISGGGASAQHGTFIKQALSALPGADLSDPDQHLALRLFRTSLVFATDNPPVRSWVARSLDILDFLRIPEDARECFFLKTAAKVLQVAC